MPGGAINIGLIGFTVRASTSRAASSMAPTALPGLKSVKIKYAREGEILRPTFDDESSVPKYEHPVNLRFRGYDFPVLEKYLKYSERIARKLGLRDISSWATPAKRETVTNYKPRSSIVDAQYDLFTYERNLQLRNCPGPTLQSGRSCRELQSVVGMLEANLPEGVWMTVKYHEKADSEIRYIPDYELQALQRELRSLDDPSVRAKLGWNPDPNA